MEKFIRMSGLFCILLVLSILLAFFCKDDTSSIPSDKTQLQIFIHDEPFKLSDKTVEHLYITVVQIDIIKSGSSEKITLFEGERQMDILAIAANDPVLLSEDYVDSGDYEQLRLILSEENTIVVDGEEHPIRVPSGQQSGIKFEGPFTLPGGRIFKFTMDFKASESVIYNRGQGYKLKPVITLSQPDAVTALYGCYTGYLPFNDPCSQDLTPAMLDFREDGSFIGRSGEEPDAWISGDYYYDSSTKILTVNDTTLHHSEYENCSWWDLRCKIIRSKIRDMDIDNIEIPIVYWDLDYIYTDVCGNTLTLEYKGEPGTCSLPEIPDPTILSVTVDNLDTEWAGNLLAVEVWRTDRTTVADIVSVELTGETTITVDVPIPDWRFNANEVEFTVAAYIGVNIDGEPSLTVSSVTGGISGSSLFTSFGQNMEKDNISINRTVDKSLTISFPFRMNIWIEPEDFSDSPTFHWDEVPGVDKYFIMISIEDQDPDDGDGTGDCPIPGFPDGDGNPSWDLLIAEIVEDTSFEYIPAPYFLQTGNLGSDFDNTPIETSVEIGTLINIEIIALLPGATTLVYDGTGIHSIYEENFIFGE